MYRRFSVSRQIKPRILRISSRQRNIITLHHLYKRKNRYNPLISFNVVRIEPLQMKYYGCTVCILYERILHVVGIYIYSQIM